MLLPESFHKSVSHISMMNHAYDKIGQRFWFGLSKMKLHYCLIVKSMIMMYVHNQICDKRSTGD